MFDINNPNIPLMSDDGIGQIISKYSTQFKIAIQPKDYRNILKQVVSVRVYGDLDHIDYPICFNETFYVPLTPSKKL